MKIKLKSNVEYEVKWKHINNTQNINRKMDFNIHYNNSSYTECEIINKNNPYILGTGIAKVGKKEKKFNKEIGRKISLKKALLAIGLDKETRTLFWEEYHKLTNQLQMKKLKVNIYNILEECVENGISGGWNKAHKHTDTPNEDHIKEQILHYIMLEISEKFKFD